MTEDWITDRLPTEADADEHGEVLARVPSRWLPGEIWNCSIEWDQVDDGTPWRHTSIWRAALAPTTTPRLFTSIAHADGRYLALADDGTAWFNYGDARGWQQLDPLPALEVTA